MLLKGSCSCGKVHFEVQSDTYYPYQLCYCSICRKTQGGGGYAINLGADARTLKVKGRKHLKVYRARVRNPGEKPHRSTGERNFCKECGSALWLYSPEWPDLVHPFASAIDTKLPVAPERTHLMLDFKATWVETFATAQDSQFDRYPEESISDWHKRHRRPKTRRAA